MILGQRAHCLLSIHLQGNSLYGGKINLKRDLINFKGIKEGIYINVNGDNLSDIKEELNNNLKGKLDFYKGIKLLGIKSDYLSPEDLIQLKYILKYKYDFEIDENLPDIIEKKLEKKPEKEIEEETELFQGTETGMTKFINTTLRSGQVAKYAGNIVIIGDVNPGALVQAGGNIIVLGMLRGVAYAGVGGNFAAVIAAYNLKPSQIKIGDKIYRSPDEDYESYGLPEIAKVKNGDLVIEPYLPNK